jgi:hypothetical protein
MCLTRPCVRLVLQHMVGFVTMAWPDTMVWCGDSDADTAYCLLIMLAWLCVLLPYKTYDVCL